MPAAGGERSALQVLADEPLAALPVGARVALVGLAHCLDGLGGAVGGPLASGELLAGIDAGVAELTRAILHHESFRRLESAWRGLRYLVDQTEPDAAVRIRVLSVGKPELARSLATANSMPWLAAACAQPFAEAGGEPVSCWLVDAEFDHSPADVEVLGRLATIGSAAQTLVIAGASPMLMQMDSWSELSTPRDLLKIFSTPEYQPWRTLRDAESSRYLALALPRFLVRLPWGSASPDPQWQDFAESMGDGVGDGGQSGLVWANAAYALAVVALHAHRRHGWCSYLSGPEAGGLVTGLCLHYLLGSDPMGPTEIGISERRADELARAGLIALVQRKRSPEAAVFSDVSVHRPAEYDDSEASAAERRAARLSCVLSCARVAHTLRCLARDVTERGADTGEVRQALRNWLGVRVGDNLALASAEEKARRPFTQAVITFGEPAADGCYTAVLRLQPDLASGSLPAPVTLSFDVAGTPL